MNSKTLLKMFLTFLTLILIMSVVLGNYSFGTTSDRFDINRFNNVVGETDVQDAVRNRAATIVVAAKYVAVSIAVIILIVISMRYMISAPADRADIKRHAVPYVIGSGILFATTAILQIIENIATSVTDAI